MVYIRHDIDVQLIRHNNTGLTPYKADYVGSDWCLVKFMTECKTFQCEMAKCMFGVSLYNGSLFIVHYIQVYSIPSNTIKPKDEAVH